MTSLRRMSSRIVARRRLIPLLVITVFLLANVPNNFYAQHIFGPVINEPAANNDTPARATVVPFPCVIHGVSGGRLVPTFISDFLDIPPIIDPITGDVVGTPRQTRFIIFLNAFADPTDWYRFSLTKTTAIKIHEAEGGGFHVLSGDILGAIIPAPVGPLVVPSDIDLLLFNRATGAFIDGAFNGPGFFVALFGGLGFAFFPEETLPSDVAPGNPFFVKNNLAPGSYLLNVDDANKFTIFLTSPGFPSGGQNLLTINPVYAWEQSDSSSYVVRIGTTGFGQPNQDAPESAPSGLSDPTKPAEIKYHYQPADRLSGAADDYYMVEVNQAGVYSFNATSAGAKLRSTGRLFLMGQDAATKKYKTLGQSVILNERLETIDRVNLAPGKYVLAMFRDGIKTFQGKFNHAVSILDGSGELVALDIARGVDLEQVQKTIEAAKQKALQGGGGPGWPGSDK